MLTDAMYQRREQLRAMLSDQQTSQELATAGVEVADFKDRFDFMVKHTRELIQIYKVEAVDGIPLQDGETPCPDCVENCCTMNCSPRKW